MDEPQSRYWPLFDRLALPGCGFGDDALAFPWHDVDGEPTGVVHVRPDKPRTVGGKRVKYEFPKGAKPGVYFVPGRTADYLYHYDDREPAPVFLTEKETAALALTALGYTAVGLGGVNLWSVPGVKPRELKPELERLRIPGRTFYVAFDSAADPSGDWEKKGRVWKANGVYNRDVNRERSLLADALRDYCRVVVLRVPPGPNGRDRGLENFLKDEGRAGLLRLVAEGEADAEERAKREGWTMGRRPRLRPKPTRPPDPAGPDAPNRVFLKGGWHTVWDDYRRTCPTPRHPTLVRGGKVLKCRTKCDKATCRCCGADARAAWLADLKAAEAESGPLRWVVDVRCDQRDRWGNRKPDRREYENLLERLPSGGFVQRLDAETVRVFSRDKPPTPQARELASGQLERSVFDVHCRDVQRPFQKFGEFGKAVAAARKAREEQEQAERDAEAEADGRGGGDEDAGPWTLVNGDGADLKTFGRLVKQFGGEVVGDAGRLNRKPGRKATEGLIARLPFPCEDGDPRWERFKAADRAARPRRMNC
jgi:hypothetical protein